MGLLITRAMGFGVACLLIAGCTFGSSPPVANQTPTQTGCLLSTLQLGPEGFAPYGLARAGPLWFSAFGRVEAGSPAILATEGGPGGPYDGWKVVIHPDPDQSGSVKLAGVQCSSGKAVRFCYTGCDWSSRVQTSALTQIVDVGRHLDYTGYMVFPGPGLMRLSASDSRGVVGTAVIEVPQISSS